MRPRLLLAVLFATPAYAIAAPPLELNAEDHGNGRYRVQAVVPDVTDVRDAQALLAPTFAQLCRGDTVTLGRYTFDATQRIDGAGPKQMRLTQDVLCGNAPPIVQDSTDRPAPSAADEARVRADMAAYLKARDAGDRIALAALYSSEMKRELLKDDVLLGQTAFRTAAGEPREVHLYELDWQDDPEGAPPGRYVAIDYVVDYATGAKSCGYVGWHWLAPDLYEIVRVEQANLERAVLDRLAPAERAAALRQMRCRE